MNEEKIITINMFCRFYGYRRKTLWTWQRGLSNEKKRRILAMIKYLEENYDMAKCLNTKRERKSYDIRETIDLEIN